MVRQETTVVIPDHPLSLLLISFLSVLLICLLFFILPTNTQLISKKNRIAAYSYLFKEGTIVVKKDAMQAQHSDELTLPNLEVMCLMKSFNSKGFLTSTYNWGHTYYYLTNEGIEYLRQYLALPEDIVPATQKKAAAAPRDSRGDNRDARGGDRKGKSAPGGEFAPEFQKDAGNKEGYRS